MCFDQIFMLGERCLQAFQWCGLHSQDHLHEMEHKLEHENWSSNFLIKGSSHMGKVQELGHGGNVSFAIWDIHVKAIVKIKCQCAYSVKKMIFELKGIMSLHELMVHLGWFIPNIGCL